MNIESKFPPELRAMSVHAPWAWLICQGQKTEEYRTRSTKRRGLTLIHSSGTKDSDYILEQYGIPIREIHRRAIIGAVTIVDCVGSNDNYAYILENPIFFPIPIQPVSGQQSIFWSASTPERIQAFNQAWAILNGESINCNSLKQNIKRERIQLVKKYKPETKPEMVKQVLAINFAGEYVGFCTEDCKVFWTIIVNPEMKASLKIRLEIVSGERQIELTSAEVEKFWSIRF